MSNYSDNINSNVNNNNTKFSTSDIKSIVRMISPLGEIQLSNEDFSFWYENLNNGEKTLVEFINRLKSNNQITLKKFLENPGNFDISQEYIINIIVSNTDEMLLFDPDDVNFSITYQPQSIALIKDSLTEVKGSFKLNNEGNYYLQITNFKLIMNGWGTFKWNK